MNKHIFITFLSQLVALTISAQLFQSKTYPQDYFIWPVKAKIAIAANFGELRNNHYHMGLDCKTEQRENLPIVAAAEGFISRVNIDATGFGRAIYITHPNGFTTLYAHLNDFFPELEAFVKKQQYLQKTWKINLPVDPQLFPVKQGQFIAYSGNTGGSQGAHLHFEIRDTQTEKVLNPLLFKMPIEDHIAPDLIRIAIYDRRISTYEQSPKIIPLIHKKGYYSIANEQIEVGSDQISFALTAYDRYTGSTNQNGIFQSMLYVDDVAVSGFEMDSISYDETRYLNAHIDYKTKASGGPYLQHLSPLPGYKHGIYRCAPGEDGVVRLKDYSDHAIRIVVKDVDNNSSEIRFKIRKSTSLNGLKKAEGVLFSPEGMNVFENDMISFYMPEYNLYDSIHFKYKAIKVSDDRVICNIHDDHVPVHGNFQIKIKDMSSAEDTAHMVIKQISNGKTRYKKGVYENGWYKAAFRSFGAYELLHDINPPVVKSLGNFKDGCVATGMNRILFSATDDSGPIAEFTATIDDQWVLFSNDKELSFVYEVDEFCPPGEHLMRVIVKDIVGNTTEKTYHFTR